MFENAFYKHMIGFFDLTLSKSSSKSIPKWWMITSPWPAILSMVSYLFFVHFSARRISDALPRSVDRNRIAKMYTGFACFCFISLIFINFTTFADYGLSVSAGEKLRLPCQPCSWCSCLGALWFNVIYQIVYIHGDALVRALEKKNISYAESCFHVLRIWNAWLALQFYQRESAIFVNFSSIGDLITIAFSLAHRFNNAAARAISDKPEVTLVWICQSMINNCIAGLVLMICKDFEQRFLWWTFEYNMLNLILIGFMSGPKIFRVSLIFVIVSLIEFFFVGFYVVYVTSLARSSTLKCVGPRRENICCGTAGFKRTIPPPPVPPPAPELSMGTCPKPLNRAFFIPS